MCPKWICNCIAQPISTFLTWLKIHYKVSSARVKDFWLLPRRFAWSALMRVWIVFLFFPPPDNQIPNLRCLELSAVEKILKNIYRAAKQQISWVVSLWRICVSLWGICITFVWPRGSIKLPAPSSQSECHLHFALIRLCLALLFIILYLG